VQCIDLNKDIQTILWPNDIGAIFSRSVIDRYFGVEFESETKCVESDDEPVNVGKETFLQVPTL
jgi:hypothetical protein